MGSWCVLTSHLLPWVGQTWVGQPTALPEEQSRAYRPHGSQRHSSGPAPPIAPLLEAYLSCYPAQSSRLWLPLRSGHDRQPSSRLAPDRTTTRDYFLLAPFSAANSSRTM